MYKVLLADDEKVILQGISTMVDWERHNTKLVGTALNGKMAFEMIEQNKPEIVITDIKMPGMDGLELIRNTREKFPDVKFIILSGYGEFEFAKKAMEFGVKHYLLKPCNENKISDVLTEVVKEIDEFRHWNELIRKTRYDLEKVLPQVKEQILKEFITNKTYGPREWDYYSQLFHFRTIKNYVRLLLFELEGDRDFEHLFALKNIASEIFSSELEVILGTSLGDRVVFLVEDYPLNKILELLEKIKHVYRKYYRLEITVAVSGEGEIGKVRTLYKECLECLTYRFYLGEGSIITNRDVLREDKKGETIQFDHDTLAFALRSGNVEKTTEYLQQFFGQIRQQKLDIDLIKSYSLELYMVITRQYAPEMKEGHMERIGLLHNMETLDQIENFVMNTAREVAQSVYESHSKAQSRIVKQMLDYIHEHLDDESLSLSKLAQDIMYMNADYLGRLFKRETGEKFTSYIVKARVERAKQLIENSKEVKIFKIAEQVGFGNNPQYFSQVFKKQTGYVPSDYKKTVDS